MLIEHLLVVQVSYYHTYYYFPSFQHCLVVAVEKQADYTHPLRIIIYNLRLRLLLWIIVYRNLRNTFFNSFYFIDSLCFNFHISTIIIEIIFCVLTGRMHYITINKISYC